MSTTIELDPVSEVTRTEVVEPPQKNRWNPRWRWEHAGLGAILLLAAFLGLWNLSINSYSNEYYAAAVRSMVQSWHNFFYVSFDPGGFVTVDKPPVAFWVQAAFVKVFGFSGVSLLLPEALAGVGGVFLLYLMVKRAFGTTAVLLSALLLAITPIFVVMNRDNNPDSILVFTLILAAWAMLRAAEKGRLRWLMLAGVLVGVAFNVKMLEAYVVLPAFFLMYFLFARTKWWKRILHLALVSVVIGVVSFSWAVAVDLTPASQRPYVDSSGVNSELDLIINYNGLGRVDGNERAGLNGTGNLPVLTGGPSNQAGFPGAPTTDSTSATTRPDDGNANFNRNGGGPGGGAGFGGQSGPTRLLTPQNGGEFNWFFPLALLGIGYVGAYAWFGMAKSEERSRRLQSVALWGGWLLTYGVVFSFSKGTFHPYYLTIMAPAQAALAGSAVVMLWQGYRRGGWQAVLLPLGLAATAFYQAYLLTGYTSWNQWLSPVLIAVGVATLVGLALGFFLKSSRAGRILNGGVTGVAMTALLATPLAWSIRAVFTPITGSIVSATPSGNGGMGSPFGGFGSTSSSAGIAQAWLTFVQDNLGGQLYIVAGVVAAGVVLLGLRFLLRQRRLFNPSVLVGVLLALFLVSSSGWWINVAQAQSTQTTSAFSSQNGFGGRMGEGQTDQQLIQYLEANRGDYKYLVAMSSSQSAAPIIIQTGLPVMSIGGFTGSDKTITSTAELEEMIANHTVRYFMLGGGGGPGGGSSVVSQYVQQNCKVVNYSSTTSTSSTTTSTTPTTDGRSMGGFGGQQQLYVCGS
jgi:4-amino-4-deoxy-L-arabinose transferase-like glycosyltransferase